MYNISKAAIKHTAKVQTTKRPTRLGKIFPRDIYL